MKINAGVIKVLKKLRVFLIIAVIAWIAITTFLYFTKSKLAEAALALSKDVETATVEMKDVMKTITATGTIESSATRTLSSTIVKDTKITAVNCEVGDYVEEGDVLVTFSYENINKTISQLQEDIIETETTEAIANSSNERQYMYSYGNEYFTVRDLQTAIDDKKRALDEACDAYGKAKEARDRIKEQYESEPDYVMSTYEIEGYEAVPNSNKTALYQSLQSAENAVSQAYQAQENAQRAYDNAKLALSDEVYKGSNTLAGATENYQKQTVTSSDASRKLKRELENYQDKLDDYVIVAPISGTVTSVKVEENNSFAGGDMITIQDCSILYITTQIDEYDIPDIELGQRVVIKTDATRDDELEGVITEVAPVATASASAASSASSTATYAVKIQIITSDERLKLGMTAKLSIVLDEAKNTLAVPYNAIVETESGDKVVYVVAGNNKDAKSNPVVNVDNSKGVGNISKDDNGGLLINGQPAQIVDGDTEGGELDKGDKKNALAKIKNFFKVAYSKPDESIASSGAGEEKEIPVTVGLESDYYSQISGDGITEGMTVVIKDNDDGSGFDFMDFGFGGR